MRIQYLTCVAALAALPTISQAQGLLSWFQLDELVAAAGAANAVPNAATGTFAGTPVFGQPSASGTAIEFDSPDDVLTVQNAPELEGIDGGATILVNFSVNSVGSLPAPWTQQVPPLGSFVPNSVGSLPQSIFGCGDWMIGIRRSPYTSQIEVVISLPGDDGMSAELPLELSDETFLAVVADPVNGLSFYGESLGSTGQPGGPALLGGVGGSVAIPAVSAGTQFRIGSQIPGLGEVLDGAVSEFQVYGGVLSASEIDDLFDAPGTTIEVGNTYCTPTAANSTGSAASFAAYGSPAVADNNLHLVGTSLPQNQSGYYLASQAQGSFPGAGGSQGTLCLGSPIVRFRSVVLHSGAAGVMSMTLDLAATLPSSTITVATGETWNLQLWYRDQSPTGAVTDYSNAVSILLQ